MRIQMSTIKASLEDLLILAVVMGKQRPCIDGPDCLFDTSNESPTANNSKWKYHGTVFDPASSPAQMCEVIAWMFSCSYRASKVPLFLVEKDLWNISKMNWDAVVITACKFAKSIKEEANLKS